eukprot:scaffold2505_cov157-Skeletonema_menzelii.AAC.4
MPDASITTFVDPRNMVTFHFPPSTQPALSQRGVQSTSKPRYPPVKTPSIIITVREKDIPRAAGACYMKSFCRPKKEVDAAAALYNISFTDIMIADVCVWLMR